MQDLTSKEMMDIIKELVDMGAIKVRVGDIEVTFFEPKTQHNTSGFMSVSSPVLSEDDHKKQEEELLFYSSQR